LSRMKAHMEQQAQEKQQQAPLVAAHAQAQVQALQAKGAADAALAKERQVAATSGIHSMHADFSAPPYGQPFQAPPDAPSAPGMVQPDMPPAMQAMHDAADLAGKHAKVQVDVAKANDLMHSAVHKVAQVHQIHHTMLHPPPAAKPRA